MYVVSALSHLGGWGLLQNEYNEIYADLEEAVQNISAPKNNRINRNSSSKELGYSPKDLSACLDKNLAQKGWEIRYRLPLDSSSTGNKFRFSEIDAIKEDVGLEFMFGKFAFSESDLFVKFPLFIQNSKFKVAVLILPTERLRKFLPIGVGSFEMIHDRLGALLSLSIRYPFVIIGIEESFREIAVIELTSDLDQYLINEVGLSLTEMKLQTEHPEYDFKLQLPDNHSLAKAICAFANNENGGLLIFGVDNGGNVIGFPKNQLDESKLRIGQVGADNCSPVPKISFKTFDIANDSSSCILVTKVMEIEEKPCMTREKVYIRADSSSRAAKPAELRRLILNSVR